MWQYLENLHNSVNRYFPNNQRQRHKIMHWWNSPSECKETTMFKRSTVQQVYLKGFRFRYHNWSLRNHYLLSSGIVSKKSIQNYYICRRSTEVIFYHISLGGQNFSHSSTKTSSSSNKLNAEENMRIQLSSINPNIKDIFKCIRTQLLSLSYFENIILIICITM